jgi:hypothetical protein
MGFNSAFKGLTKYFNWRQYCNYSEEQTVGSLMVVLLNQNMQEHLLYILM